MAHSACLQDWITITGNTSTTVIQAEADWLQIPSFQDIIFYTEVSSVTNANTTTLSVQTSPTKDDVFFNAGVGGAGNAYVASYSLSSATSAGVQSLQVVRWATTTTQAPSKFLRWKLAFPVAGPTTITFRIWLSLNQAGWR
jgi:hypothetical protein